MKAFVIYLKDREHSVKHSDYMIKTLRSYGIDADLFEGTPGDVGVKMVEKSKKILYPYSIKNRVADPNEIDSYLKEELREEFKDRFHVRLFERNKIGDGDKGKLSRPGVIGCFYSHYALWQKCIDLNEPIMIFEDDVKFYRGFESVHWDDVLILSLGKSSFLGEPWKTYLENPAGHPQAVSWHNFSMPGASGYAIKPHAAIALTKFYKPYYYPADNAINQYICKIQISTHIMGRNLLDEEGNISMTKAKGWV